MFNNLEKFRTPDKEKRRQIRDGLDEYDTEDQENKREECERFERACLSKTSQFIKENGDDGVDKVYEWYEKAMTRKDRDPLDFSRFCYHFFERGSLDETYMLGDLERGYLLGFVKAGVFIPAHFAPKSIRKGYELMKDLGGSKDIPAVLSITEDLVKTITKMPEWKVVDFSSKGSFRGEAQEKYFVYNSHPDIDKLLGVLLQEYLDEQAKQFSYGNE